MYYPLQNTCMMATSATDKQSVEPSDLRAAQRACRSRPAKRTSARSRRSRSRRARPNGSTSSAPGMLSLMSTGGGLVFGGDVNGRFRAYDQRTGEVLWEINLGAAVNGYPVTYAVERQAVRRGQHGRLGPRARSRPLDAGAAARQRQPAVRVRAAIDRSDDRARHEARAQRPGGRSTCDSHAPSEATRNGILTTLGADGRPRVRPERHRECSPSARYITPIEQEFGWSRVDVSFAFTLVAYMIVLDVAAARHTRRSLRSAPRRADFDSAVRAELGGDLFHAGRTSTSTTCSGRIVPVAGLGLWPLGYLQAVTPWFDRKLGLALGCANAGIGVGSTLAADARDRPDHRGLRLASRALLALAVRSCCS